MGLESPLHSGTSRKRTSKVCESAWAVKSWQLEEEQVNICPKFEEIPPVCIWDIAYTRTRRPWGHSDLQPPPTKSNQLIFESKWTSVPNLTKFPRRLLGRLNKNGMDRRTTKNLSDGWCRRQGKFDRRHANICSLIRRSTQLMAAVVQEQQLNILNDTDTSYLNNRSWWSKKKKYKTRFGNWTNWILSVISISTWHTLLPCLRPSTKVQYRTRVNILH